MTDFSRLGALQTVTYILKVVVSKKWRDRYIIIIHEYYYGGAVALLLQDHLTMSVSRFAGYKTCPGVNLQGNTP